MISPAPETWQALVFTQGEPIPCGITTGIPEALPGLYATADQAMAAGIAAMGTRPELYCCTSRRVPITSQQRRERDRLRTALQAPIGPLRVCVLYLVNGKEQRTPWFHSYERANQALRIMAAKYGERNVGLHRD